MIALQSLRNALLSGTLDDLDIGLKAVSLILKISDQEASEWIAVYGDPICDPIAGVFLANSVSIDGGVILNTCLVRRDLASKNGRSKLAEDTLVLLLTTLIVFGEGGRGEAPIN